MFESLVNSSSGKTIELLYHISFSLRALLIQVVVKLGLYFPIYSLRLRALLIQVVVKPTRKKCRF